MADGMMAMDPDDSWKSMKKAGKALFQRLGALRDVQIMMEWIEKLESEVLTNASDPTSNEPRLASEEVAGEMGGAPSQTATTEKHDGAARALVEILRTREAELKIDARKSLAEFDRKQWRQWSKSLPLRAARIRPGSAVFQHLALERWTIGRELHVRAMRGRSQVALHTLRIGIKRFRYIVENFLPKEHAVWSNDLKHMQDLLGEVHDLDVLWATAISCNVFSDEASRKIWQPTIIAERTKRVEEYRHATIGPTSLWALWRAGLPQGKRIQELATRRMKMWAKALDPDFAHSERVARLSLQLYDGLMNSGLIRMTEVASPRDAHSPDLRSSLYAAALLHDVGKAKGEKGHHKKSAELIKKHGTPLVWKDEDMRRAALVARFHTGALPSRSHKALRDLLPEEQRHVIRLSAILRLANALDSAHDGSIRGVKFEQFPAKGTPNSRANGFLRKKAPAGNNEAVVIAAEGYVNGGSAGRVVAAERYLLETVLKRPIIVRAASGFRSPTTLGKNS